MKLKLETNPRNPLDVSLQLSSGAALLLTAPPQDCWVFRIRLSPRAALTAIPHFGGIGISLDNGHLTTPQPYEADAAQIARRLSSAARPTPYTGLIPAIRTLQAAVRTWRLGTPSTTS
jgi:hypothetical protein